MGHAEVEWSGTGRRMIEVRAAFVIVVVAACGGTRTSQAPVVANHAPPAPDASVRPERVPEGDESKDESCEPSGDTAVRVAGRDYTARLVTCDLGEEHPNGDEAAEQGFVIHHKRADLVLDRAGDEITTTLGEWDNGWEDGSSWILIGALGDGAVVVEANSYGPADGLDGESAVLQVMAVRGPAWEKVYETSAPEIEAKIAGGVATLETRDQSGDKTLELRWDGVRVDERDVTSAP